MFLMWKYPRIVSFVSISYYSNSSVALRFERRMQPCADFPNKYNSWSIKFHTIDTKFLSSRLLDLLFYFAKVLYFLFQIGHRYRGRPSQNICGGHSIKDKTLPSSTI